MKKIITLLALALALSGCATIAPNRITAADKRGELHEGMNFSEVVAIAGRSVSFFEDEYKEEVIGGNIYKSWSVRGKYPALFDKGRVYEFKFKDDKLVSWSWHWGN